MFIEILFKMLLFKGGVFIYAENCINKKVIKKSIFFLPVKKIYKKTMTGQVELDVIFDQPIMSSQCVLCLKVKTWFEQQWILVSDIYRQSPRAAAFSGATHGTTCVDSSQTRAPYSGQFHGIALSLNFAYICQGKCWVMFLWATIKISLTITNLSTC